MEIKVMTTRSEYIEKAKARLDRWDAQIQEMEARIAETEADSKAAYKAQLDDMEGKRDEAQHLVERLQTSSGEALDDLSASAEASLKELKQGFEKATQRFA
jgi:multidrug resistance efflux pump